MHTHSATSQHKQTVSAIVGRDRVLIHCANLKPLQVYTYACTHGFVHLANNAIAKDELTMNTLGNRRPRPTRFQHTPTLASYPHHAGEA